MVRASNRAPTPLSGIRVYVEGGGDVRASQSDIKKGFANLFRRACPDLPAPKVIACGGRSEAFRDFEIAIAEHADELCLLLVDSESPVAEGVKPWTHVGQRAGDRWKRPEGAHDDHLHFMAQAMESWIMADPAALAQYYKQDFKLNALKATTDLETIDKKDLAAALELATRATRRGPYKKSDGFVLIGLVDPQKVRARCPRHAERFFKHLRDTLAALDKGARSVSAGR